MNDTTSAIDMMRSNQAVSITNIEQAAVPNYSASEHMTWERLITNQMKVLPYHACDEYLDGLDIIQLPQNHIPKLIDISKKIESCTGWKLIRVDGYVPETVFFQLLSQKCFPSTDFIRKPEELDYTPAPDMFHDLLGHAPLLTQPKFTAFFESYAQAAIAASQQNHPMSLGFSRLYWFTVEFGLIKQKNQLKAYGAGLMSSPKELIYSLSEKTEKYIFNIDQVTNTSFDIWHMQDKLFVIDDFDQLEEDIISWCIKNKIHWNKK